ncbi:MAG TPA: hypothetical protein VGM75_22785, partial [Pseudonocardiaceae bacterium]
MTRAWALRALGIRCGLTHTEIKHPARTEGHRGQRQARWVHPRPFQLAGAPNLITLAGRSALGHPVDYAAPVLEEVCFMHHNLVPTRPCT